MACSKPPACSGALRFPIVIQRETLADDGAGGQTVTWQTVWTGRASVNQMSAGERWAHQRLQSEATHRFVIRYADGILASDKIIFQDTEFNITGPPDNWEYKNRWLTIYATEGVVQ